MNNERIDAGAPLQANSVRQMETDTERRFSVLLEQDNQVVKWFNPRGMVFQVHYRVGPDEVEYEPDFVVETDAVQYLCEPKAKDALNDPVIVKLTRPPNDAEANRDERYSPGQAETSGAAFASRLVFGFTRYFVEYSDPCTAPKSRNEMR